MKDLSYMNDLGGGLIKAQERSEGYRPGARCKADLLRGARNSKHGIHGEQA